MENLNEGGDIWTAVEVEKMVWCMLYACTMKP